MNINNIFDSFKNPQEENDETSLMVDFSEHPLFWIGGFNKVISNNLFFRQYTAKMFKDVQPDLDMDEVQRAGEHLMYEKAWDYIKSIKLDNQFHVDCIQEKASSEFFKNVVLSIKHFEKLEEYEKCALLKSIEDKINEALS